MLFPGPSKEIVLQEVLSTMLDYINLYKEIDGCNKPKNTKSKLVD